MSKEIFLAKNHISYSDITPVHGGDINQAWRIKLKSGDNYFLKQNNANEYPQMLSVEAESLLALNKAGDLVVPSVVAVGEENGQQFLLLQWLDKAASSKTFWEDFGSSLAYMHRQPQPYFGWQKNNYIGSLLQINTPTANWAVFYSQCRLMPLAAKLFQQKKINHVDVAGVEKLCVKMDARFPQEGASFLHGDLWSGNFLCTAGGKAAIFDPAVYYGHREMDLGMTRLFGGFAPAFYDAYQETYRLETGWQERVRLTQLYPVMVHAVLFGGHYVKEAMQITTQYS